jgi:thiamine biosynthesis lipoprotein
MNTVSRRQSLLLFSVAILVVGFLLLNRQSDTDVIHEFGGGTMGTRYSVKLTDLPADKSLEQIAFDASGILQRVDREQMSTYAPDSELSRLNAAAVGQDIALSAEMTEVLALALELNRVTDGAFDVTVGPLVNRWGFGPEERREDRIPTQAEIDTLLARVGSHHLILDIARRSLRKTADVYVDLSGIAKGYAVDKVADYLDSIGVTSYFIEVGGELRIRGYKPGNQSWVPAIEKPVDTAPQVHNIFYARGEPIAVAGSGDYRNYFEADGVHYSHEIDPQTGRPITHTLAGVYVIDSTAARADALATAFMVLGAERGFALAEELGLAVYFVTRDDVNDTFVDRYTSRFEHYLESGD